MTPSLANPPRFRLARQDGAHLEFTSDQDFTAHLFVLEPDIMRVVLLRGSRFQTPRTWSIAPGEDDVAEAGRDRFDTTGFSLPPYDVTQKADAITIATSRLRVSINPIGFSCTWQMMTARGWHPIARDRGTQAYNFGWWGPKVHHYLARSATERYYGLGERSGNMDRALRRFQLKNTDAMGYNAAWSDPLYKHIPFYITYDTDAATAFGLFYDTYADCVFDFGAEISNYHGPYRSFVADAGDLDFYVMAGPTVADVTHRYTWLTGRPALPPKWSLGYSGSTMSYTDAPDAQERMADFIAKCRTHDILCDSFHLSSGYTSIGSKRHVFHWNREKFPNPAAFVQSYHNAGIRLCANVKPCLLTDNPLFAEAQREGLIIRNTDGEPAWVQFWSGLGAYVDFTNPAARAWWAAHVTSDLLAYGIDATWNDNNEFEILSPDASAHGFDGPIPAVSCKPLHTLLMIRSSRDAQRAFHSDRRPFLVSRSGAVGMQRYAQTWSGDNFTSWETLRFNIKMGLGLALSGISNAGHDIGGFAGPAPDPELFIRWVEAGVFMPRFSIHSWNSDGTVNEPWMHRGSTDRVRDLIKLRYAFLPYLYDLTWRYRTDFEPIWRPTFHDFPNDQRCYDESDAFLLGSQLLVAQTCEPGMRRLAVYLPEGCGWFDFWSGERFPGGQSVDVEAPLGRPVVFAKEGAAIPLNIAEQHFELRSDDRAFAIFAPGNGRVDGSCFEDDGESLVWRNGKFGHWEIAVACGAKLQIDCRKTGTSPPQSPTLTILFRPCETRPVTCRSGTIASDAIKGDWRRVVIALNG